ncbi:amidohydrolase [Dokdonia sinensis]|uniref:Omega-amidase YafV n=1 Tax=Dokdonia sinensis TaxID=2479847 RepID=A0A3M0FZU3_9FLAO|nr:amidohydrolase [Dokdonia sinensis]RMB58025.1 amidohydrolase [Dokdonia sinensis]
MKKNKLNVALIQADLIWEDAVKNRAYFDKLLSAVPSETDIVVLPEMFTTGFSMNPSPLAETMDGATVRWLKKNAERSDIAICGSIIIQENDKFYNRFLFVQPSGKVTSYDKRHTFNMAGEGKKYAAGKKRVYISYLGWKIFPQICYDLRFPVFSRNTTDYDLIIYVANWPKTRIAAWDTLLKSRAIENMSYSIGVNRVGTDGNDLEYIGHSGVYNVLGEECAFAKAEEKLITATLSKSHIAETRKKLPFLEDKDQFQLF